MNLAPQCGWALLRALAAGVLCVLLGQRARAGIVRCGPTARRVGWILLLLPFLVPSLLVGYGYSHFSLSLVHHPVWNELLYLALVVFRLTPVAAVALHVAPAGPSPQALHCRRLARAETGSLAPRLHEAAFRLRASAGVWAAAFALVFLLAFGEFELASLFGISAWTVSLFDAHAGGLPLGRSVRLALLPLVVELLLMFALLAVVLRWRGAQDGEPGASPAGGPARRVGLWLYLAVALAATGLVPAAVVARDTLQGFGLLARHPGLVAGIGGSLLFGVSSAVCAYAVAGVLLHGLQRGSRSPWALATLAAVVPGLVGPLVLSLLLLALFQAPLLRRAYDTPVLLWLCLSVLLVPFALVLRLLLAELTASRAAHVAGAMAASAVRRVRRAGRRLLWDLRVRRRFWVVFLLFCWGYFDLTASAVLAPSTVTPVGVRLYNLMHYGRSAALGAMLCITLCIPLLLLLLAEAAKGGLARLWTHA